MSSPIRILIADDHPLFRAGLGALLESVADTEVVGEAETGDEAVTAAAALAPDVVVMDINMPGLNGIDATRRITDDNAAINVLMMTMQDDDDASLRRHPCRRPRLPAQGAVQEETLRAIRSVANGEAIFGPGIADRLQHFLSRPPSDPNLAFPQLTSRETEILHLLAKHRTNSEIAAELFLSQKTVRNYVSAIFAKLHVADRAEAGRLARDAGLGERSVDQPLR